MEKEMQHIYQEIAETVNQMIPEEWHEFYFYAQVSDTGAGVYFFYNTPENKSKYQYSLDIPEDFNLDEDEFDEVDDYLYKLGYKMRDVFKRHNQDLWYSFTMHLDASGKLGLVYSTLDNLLENGFELPAESYLHSDQGMHYTHPIFQHKVRQLGFTQSMSRRGNCWDNAPIESFFGHLKDEVDIKGCQSISALKALINEYILDYNTSRYQWDLKKMTPNQYRDHLLAA